MMVQICQSLVNFHQPLVAPATFGPQLCALLTFKEPFSAVLNSAVASPLWRGGIRDALWARFNLAHLDC